MSLRAVTASTATVALAIAGLWLPASQAAIAASDPITIVVTDPGDYPAGDTPVPGTLRAALETVAEDSQSTPGDYRVEVPASVGQITLDEGLSLFLGPEATGFELAGGGTDTTIIDFSGSGDLMVMSGSSLNQLSVSDVTFAHGFSVDLGHAQQQTELTNVALTGFEMLSFGSLVSDSMSDVSVDGARVDIRTFETRQAPYSFDLSAGTFTNAPMTVALTGTTAQSVTVTESTLRDSENEPALFIDHPDTGVGVASLKLSDSEVSNNTGGGLIGYFLDHTAVTDTEFTGNSGESALSLQSPREGAEPATFDLQRLNVSGNETTAAAIKLDGSAKSVSITGSVISENKSSGIEAGGLYVLMQAAEPAAESAFTIADTTFEGNSGAIGGVMVDRWLRTHPGSKFSIERSTFSNNEGQGTAGDFAVDGVDEGSTLKISDSTFENGQAPGYDAGRSISYGPVLGGTAVIENTTISVPQGDAPAIYGKRFDDASNFAITHTTLTGGGIELEGDRGPDLVGTVIDTESEPLRVSVNAGAPGVVESVFTTTPATLLPTATVVTSAELALGPLADNGGSTKTQLPGPTSVLVNAMPTSPLSTDQRGVSRPQGGAADVGAVEVQGATVALVKDLRVTEGEDAVIEIRRSGTSDGVTTGTAQSADDSAKAGVDYTKVDGSFQFEPGSDPDSVRLVIPTMKRSGAQGDRSFVVSLADTDAATSVGDPEKITVTIVDPDSGGPDPKPNPDVDPSKPQPVTKLPNTGSGPGTGMWIAAALAALLAGSGILLSRRRRS